MKTNTDKIQKILFSITGIIYLFFCHQTLRENYLTADFVLVVLCVLFLIETIIILNGYVNLRFYYAIYTFSEVLLLLSSLFWAVDTHIRHVDAGSDPFYTLPTFLVIVMQALAIGYLIIKKYTKWNRYSFVSKYFLVLSFSILFTNKLSTAKHSPADGNLFPFIVLVCIIFSLAGIFTIAISVMEVIKYPSFIMYIIGYIMIFFGNYSYLVSKESILYTNNVTLPDIVIIGGNFLIILSFYYEKKFPWLSYTTDEKNISFNKKLYIIIGILLFVTFTLFYIFDLIDVSTSLVAGIISLCFILLVIDQHARMLTEQLYIQKKAENDHLERLVERRTNALRIANDHLRQTSITDTLTGLFNRCEYMNTITRYLEQNDTTPLSIVCVNIRNFKQYNIEYGYEVGDLILAEIGKRLLKLEDDKFSSYRVDGNEFLILAKGDFEKAEIEELLRYIRHIVEEPIIDGKNIYKLDTTFSYAMYPIDTDTPKGLFTLAENALIKAKNNL